MKSLARQSKSRRSADQPRQKPKIGRPTKFSASVSARICEQLALGDSLRAICKADEMPSRQTVFRWLEVDSGFRVQYARARELQADTFADEIVDIADSAQDFNLARLKIDARKWAAAKQRPSRYSERVVNELTGKNGAAVAVKTEATLVLDEATKKRINDFMD